jgi:XTP/dITP diphosphohydrolase
VTSAGAPADDPVRGMALVELVAVMDRLRSPGGCPWDAEQTHASLAPYLIEETYEALEAIDAVGSAQPGARAHLAEELGDVLLQVVFHARVAQEHPDEPFDIDTVADGITAKLRRRHPHVFGDVVATTPQQVSANWAAIKAAERAAEPPSRAAGPEPETGVAGVLRGIPAGMPPLARAAQVVARVDRAGVGAAVAGAADDSPGGRLLALVAELVRAGLDPDTELRAALRRVPGHLDDRTVGRTD